MKEINLNLKLWPKQGAAYLTEATELLFGGATRGGKSHMMRVALITWCLEIPNLQCTLIRKKYQDILDNHVYGPSGFKDLLRPLIQLGQATVTREAVTFPNGSRIAFKHCQDERQFETAQGIPSHVLAVDEATQIVERLLKTFRVWCTMPEEMKATLPERHRGRFPRIIYTANPIGVSVGYFRRRFVKPRPEGTIEPVEGFKRQFIKSLVKDNPSEDSEATRGRVQGMHDPATARALLEGDWDAPTGDYYPEWDEDKHVVPDFLPPSWWYRYRTFDWGTLDPHCVMWWAVSDGESFQDEDGRTRWFPRGALVCYREWYGCDAHEPTKGSGIGNEAIAHGILKLSPDACERHVVTLTDSLPFQDRGERDKQAAITIADKFREWGVPLSRAGTARIPGWTQLRIRLVGTKIDINDAQPTPLIYFVESCHAARDYIPTLPRDPKQTEDAVKDGEATHVCDCVRYACNARPYAKDAPRAEPTTVHPNNPTFDHVMKQIHKRKQRAHGASAY